MNNIIERGKVQTTINEYDSVTWKAKG